VWRKLLCKVTLNLVKLLYPFPVHVVIFNFYYQFMHLLIKTQSQFTFKTTHVKMSVLRT